MLPPPPAGLPKSMLVGMADINFNLSISVDGFEKDLGRKKTTLNNAAGSLGDIKTPRSYLLGEILEGMLSSEEENPCQVSPPHRLPTAPLDNEIGVIFVICSIF